MSSSLNRQTVSVPTPRSMTWVTDCYLGTLACSPFHVRFGKFSLLRPSEKKVRQPCSTLFYRSRVLTLAKVEFKVNDVKQNYSMKLGDGGEAFFVFETTEDIPEALQTSPLVSPAASPQSLPEGQQSTSTLPEPDYLDLEGKKGRTGSSGKLEAGIPVLVGAHSDLGEF
jgi:phosphatidate phosphatase LPIN